MLAHAQEWRAADQYQECRLECVFGGMSVAEHLPADGQDRWPVARQDRLERRLGVFGRVLPAPGRGGKPLEQLAVGQPDAAAWPEELPQMPAHVVRSHGSHVRFPQSLVSGDATVSSFVLPAGCQRDSVF